jgi:hypothetical protein
MAFNTYSPTATLIGQRVLAAKTFGKDGAMPPSMQPSRCLDLRRAVLADQGGMLVVAGIGSPSWNMTVVGNCPENLPLWGGMATAAMIALALAKPSRKVLVIIGDGEMLMGFSNLAGRPGCRKPIPAKASTWLPWPPAPASAARCC